MFQAVDPALLHMDWKQMSLSHCDVAKKIQDICI